MMGKRELWLFTIRFPYGNGESFLENELPVLARGFERVKVFPLMPEGAARPVPPNVEVVRLFDKDAYAAAGLATVLGDLRRFLHALRVSRASAPSPAVYTKHRRTLISRIRQALYREGVLRARCGAAYDPAHVTLYSYWTSDWATVLGLWKLRDPRVRFHTRMMGFDMYDHRSPDNWQMLQAFHLEQVDRVFVIAQAGMDHLTARFPQHRDKLSLSYLATNDHGAAPWSPASTLRVVSCANLVPLKRVHLLAEALALVKGPVEWTHFGEGTERDHVEQRVSTLPAHVQVRLKGSVPNAEILAWYKAVPVDVFVHTSETEGGAPVALQEAASFGIPLLAADAGGVREIVTPATGVLLPHSPTPAMLAAQLDGWRSGPWCTPTARAGVRAFWRAHFFAEEVHGRLLAELLR